MSAVRVRIGVRLPWPVKNAGIFVVYMSETAFSQAADALGIFLGLLSSSGPQGAEIAGKFVFERF